jgi:hypothetical protein
VLVRAPQISGVDCAAGATNCTVHGKNLFFAAAFSADKEFAHPTQVPTGFAEESLQVPAPSDGATLYLRLRDDPSALAALALPNPVKPAATAATAAVATPIAAPAAAATPPPQVPKL